MNILELTKQAGGGIGTSGRWLLTQDELERFAALVRAEERERCANVCNDLLAPFTIGGLDAANIYHRATDACAAAIRGMKDE